MSRTKKLLAYIAGNGAVLFAMYQTFHEHSAGASNLLLFLLWIAIIGAFPTLHEDVSAKLRASPPVVPVEFDVVFDLCICAVLAWHAWFWTAAFYFVHILLFMNARRLEVGRRG